MTTRPTIRDYLRTVLETHAIPEGFHRDRETLHQLVDAKVRTRHIAEAADVSRAAIYKQLKKYGIDPPHGNEGNTGGANAHEPYQTLQALDPDDVGRPTPEGDNSWRDYYRDSDEGQV